MNVKKILLALAALVCFYTASITGSGCAQIVMPTGGPRDSTPPVLVNASPENGSVNFKGNKITLTFDEYITLEQVSQNLLVSPTPKINPYIDFKLKTVTIKIKDTLEPNTTYTINLGNAIRDINEANILKDYSYVFSTGKTLDSMEFSGKVIMAETGRIDTTIIAMLYNKLSDTAVIKFKPKYIARVDHEGNFHFTHLAPGTYNVFALKDDDNMKTYNSKVKVFAFADSTVNIGEDTKPVTLYAFAGELEKPKTPVKTTPSKDKILKFNISLSGSNQDLLNDLTLQFNKKIKTYDSSKIVLTDTLYNHIPGVKLSMDSTAHIISLHANWKPATIYKLIIDKSAVADSTGLSLAKSDTIKFSTKKEEDYGILKLRFLHFDASKNPVLQFVVNNVVTKSVPLTVAEWSSKLFPPGEYEIRILFDRNKNGIWDPGDYSKHLQPERAFTLPEKLSIRADWENERDIDISEPK